LEKVNLTEKLGLIDEHWKPHLVAELDDYEIKLVRIEGDFVWHKHDHDDELFFVIKGGFRMDFRDHHVELGEGELIVVPKGVEHKPFAEQECQVMLLERRGVINTGGAPAGELTRQTTPRI
jgi:mannose-6-phosphate isomerase-like protein (cupin superfamily)